MKRRNITRRAYATILIAALMSLGICLASISPQKLSADILQRDGVYSYLRAMNIVDHAMTSGEVNRARTLIHAFGASALNHGFQFWSIHYFPFPDIASYSFRGDNSALDCASQIIHGADMVARK